MGLDARPISAQENYPCAFRYNSVNRLREGEVKKIPSVEFLLDREESFVIVFSISLSFLLIIVTERGTITYCWRNLFWIDLSVGSRNLIIDKRCEIIMSWKFGKSKENFSLVK